MIDLLDVNVLVALLDPGHVALDAAHSWFERVGSRSWATCPLTENGVLRIIGHARYPNTPGSPAAVAKHMAVLRGLAGHVFWSDDISLIGSDIVDTSRILTSSQVTDTYLLALAGRHGGSLATFDRRLSAAAVKSGTKALHLIGS